MQFVRSKRTFKLSTETVTNTSYCKSLAQVHRTSESHHVSKMIGRLYTLRTKSKQRDKLKVKEKNLGSYAKFIQYVQITQKKTLVKRGFMHNLHRTSEATSGTEKRLENWLLRSLL